MVKQACSIIIVGYNSAQDLILCLESVFAQTLSSSLSSTLGSTSYEVILVDNASVDETEQIVGLYKEKHGARLRYIPLEENVGFAAGNNIGASKALGEYLIFVNPDTVVHAGWLDAILQPLVHQPIVHQPIVQDAQVGMTTSRILRADKPHLLNACGNDITWTGITVCRGIDEPADAWDKMEQVSAVSGASFAMSNALFQQLEGFDERFFIYYEDTDLSSRVRMLGYQILYVPDSILRHKYIFKFSAQKAYYQERNRWISLLKILRIRTLIVLLPGLLVGELMAWTFAAMQGWDHVRAKAAGWRWIWQHRSEIRQQRAAVYQLRRTHGRDTNGKLSDRELIRHWSPNLRFANTMPKLPATLLERCIQPMLRGYGSVCRLLAT